ncbi:MAG: hypothetical protein RL693_2467 [Verrucomicrobiota bacterium]
MKLITTLLLLSTFIVCAADGLYVAVGYGGRRMTSKDGIHWENIQQWADVGKDDSNNLMSLAYGLGKFVCVGGGGWSKETQAGHILVSNDGKDWREVAKYPFRVNPVLFQDKLFVAGGPSKQLLWSSDGEKWNEGGTVKLPEDIPGYAFWFRGGATGNGTFVFIGNAGKDQKTLWCLTTRDGKTIESFTTGIPSIKGLAFGSGKFVLAGSDGLHTSVDGKSWERASGSPSEEMTGVVATGKGLLATSKTSLYASSDAINWTSIGKAPPGSLACATENGMIGTGWPGKMFFSKDGQKWEPAGQPLPGLGINKVVYGIPQP